MLGFPITFQNGAAVSSETMGSLGGTAWRVCQDDGVCTFAPNNGAAPAGDLTSFNGQAANGTWKLRVGDGTAGDVGSIDEVVLTLGKQQPFTPRLAGTSRRTRAAPAPPDRSTSRAPPADTPTQDSPP